MSFVDVKKFEYDQAIIYFYQDFLLYDHAVRLPVNPKDRNHRPVGLFNFEISL